MSVEQRLSRVEKALDAATGDIEVWQQDWSQDDCFVGPNGLALTRAEFDALPDKMGRRVVIEYTHDWPPGGCEP